jgi:hypothetical protein
MDGRYTGEFYPIAAISFGVVETTVGKLVQLTERSFVAERSRADTDRKLAVYAVRIKLSRVGWGQAFHSRDRTAMGLHC